MVCGRLHKILVSRRQTLQYIFELVPRCIEQNLERKSCRLGHRTRWDTSASAGKSHACTSVSASSGKPNVTMTTMQCCQVLSSAIKRCIAPIATFGFPDVPTYGWGWALLIAPVQYSISKKEKWRHCIRIHLIHSSRCGKLQQYVMLCNTVNSLYWSALSLRDSSKSPSS
jgi:hypothetical protein